MVYSILTQIDFILLFQSSNHPHILDNLQIQVLVISFKDLIQDQVPLALLCYDLI